MVVNDALQRALRSRRVAAARAHGAHPDEVHDVVMTCGEAQVDMVCPRQCLRRLLVPPQLGEHAAVPVGSHPNSDVDTLVYISESPQEGGGV